MVAAVTSSPWLVHMLEVALLRRMCSSRACSVRLKPGRPSTSRVPPTIRPGICRTYCMRGHQQSLVGAYVGGRLAAPNVLLPRLQRQTEARPAFDIQGPADDSAGHLPHVLHARRHEAEVGAARSERHAERLALAAHD